MTTMERLAADLDGSAEARAADGRRRVLIFDSDNDPSLIGILNRLDFRVELTKAEDPLLGQGARGATAGIVSDFFEGALKVCAALSPACPVVLLCDRPSFALRLAAAEAGVTALIQRPVNQSELSEWLEHFASGHASESISVLIVDDDWLTTELYSEVLEASGIRVTSVNDPRQTLQAIENAEPDLILMDVQMPVADGIKMARIIRQTRRYRSLPIIFLSAERDEDRQLVARQLGGDDFIAKSISPEKLVSLVRLRADRSKFLRSLIERDGLTGLYDHRRFRERLWQETERCRRSGAECTLVMIDIDHFKRVNDNFGHPAGDEVIRALSHTLTSALRRIDIIGRCGGEEFGVILLDTAPQSAQLAIGKLKIRFAGLPFSAGSDQFSVTFSAGVASSRDYDGVHELVGAADRALYKAKRNGRDRIELAPAPRGEEQPAGMDPPAPSATAATDRRQVL